MFSITAKTLRAILEGVPDDAPLLLQDISGEHSLVEDYIGYVTSAEDAPYVSNGDHRNVIDKNGALVVHCHVF